VRPPQPGQSTPWAVDWKLELSPARCPIAPLAAAALSTDGREIVAIGGEAVARYRNGQWTIDPAPDTAAGVRSLVALGEDSYLATTTSGALLKLGRTGGLQRWGPKLDRFAFLGGLVEGNVITLVGGTTDTRRHGVVARLVGESVTIVTDDLDRTLLGAAHLHDGSLLGVGEGGSIVRLRGGKVVESTRPCDLDLLAVRVSGAEALVVGSGAWAFRVTTSPLTVHLEAVDTLSTLSCLAIDETGGAWAGSQKGRLLRRHDGHWRRMNRDVSGDPAVLAIYASTTRVRAILADGRVVLGQPISV
jgi:hypothetical protein